MRFSKTINIILILLCIALPLAATAADATTPTTQYTPGTPAQQAANTTTNNGTGTPLQGGQDSAVAALEKVCGTKVVAQQGQLQIFSVGVKCFENMVNGLAESSILAFSQYLQDIVYTTLILWLIIYGAKVSLGMSTGEQAKKDFAIHALKIAFVAWLVFSFGLIEIFNLVMQSYFSLIEIVLNGAQLGDCGASATFSTGGTTAIWTTMDCMVTKFVGWEAANGSGGQPYKNVPLFFGIIYSKMLPANGFVIGGILFSALWALMSGFFRMAFVYILSIIALILLFAIAPMFIPMMLFKATYRYFEGWWKLVVSMVLQPVILFAFFSFVASLMTTTIENLQKLYKDLEIKAQTAGVNVTGDTHSYKQTVDAVSKTLSSIDPQMILSGVTTLIIAYLLISFINFVSAMALELAGAGSAPELGGGALAGGMMNLTM